MARYRVTWTEEITYERVFEVPDGTEFGGLNAALIEEIEGLTHAEMDDSFLGVDARDIGSIKLLDA